MSSYNQRLCDILGQCAAFSWLARGRCERPKRRVTKAEKCLRLTTKFQFKEEDQLCTTDLFIAEVWARKYYLRKMEWVNGLIMWHFTRSAQQCGQQPIIPSTTTPPISPKETTPSLPPPPSPPKRTAPLLRIRPPGKCSSVK